MSKLPDRETAVKFLEENGWGDYYNPNYFVHPKTVDDPKRQDYTNYGMDWKSAWLHEKYDLPPFKCYGFPALGQRLADKPNFTKEEWAWLSEPAEKVGE